MSKSGGTDKSYYEGVSENLSLSCGRQIEGLQEASATDQKLSNNKNLSEGTKDTARALNAIDAGIQGFGMITGALDSGIESALLPMMAGLGLKGMASLPISKQLDPVLGIDIHLVNIPPAVSVPMPHPYIGTLLNPKDFIAVQVASLIPAPPAPPEPEDPDNVSEQEQQAANDNKMLTIAHTGVTMAVGMLGASVKIGGSLPRAVAGTSSINIPHFPMGAGFTIPPRNAGHAFMGSLVALADNDPISGGGVHLHLNCSDPAGIISPHPNVKPAFYLPTGMITPIPPPFPILTNPVPTPMNPVAAISNKIKSSFGRLFKRKKKNSTKTTAADSMGGRLSQKGKNNNAILISRKPKKKKTNGAGYGNGKRKKQESKKKWQKHEEKVTKDLNQKHLKKIKGEQITLEVEGIGSDNKPFKKRIRIDNIYETNTGSFQLVDAKHSSKKDLTNKSVNLRNTFTKNQKIVYDAIGGNGKVTKVTPVGQRALDAGLTKPIQLEPSVKVGVNTPSGGILYRTYP